jgi:hypothetical protein
MKKILILSTLLSVIVLANCQQKSEEKTTTTDSTAVAQETMVGNDIDKHGCKGSAGYQWSVVKNDCVRIFEVGVRLDAADTTLNQTLSAFAVFANDEKENEFDAEIFLPSLADSSLILKPIKDDGAGTWGNGTYTLTQWKGMFTLEEGKKTIYQGHR